VIAKKIKYYPEIDQLDC